MKCIKRFFVQDEGATAIEYSLIAAGIALSIIAIVFLLGDEVVAMFLHTRAYVQEYVSIDERLRAYTRARL